LIQGVLAIAAIAWVVAAGAQTYPARPVRIIVGQSPGGATDIFARIVAQKMSEAWKQPVVVENRSGAAGAIGAELTVKAPPDGYTLLLATAGQIVINPHFIKLSFDPLKDLVPITFFAAVPLMLVEHPSVPAKSVRELVALAKARPDTITHGSGGNGSPAHLAAELFKIMAGVRMTHVPFKGVGPAVTAVVAGQIDWTFASVIAVLPHVKGKRLRGLAVSTTYRSRSAPDVPTVAEAGVPGYDFTTWYGFFGPAALPREVAGRINAEVMRILGLADVRERLTNDGSEPGNLTPEQFVAFIHTEAARWGKLIRTMNIKGE
jgi:tripartite-type tricarboxylate transporter receptor subunit TctC